MDGNQFQFLSRDFIFGDAQNLSYAVRRIDDEITGGKRVFFCHLQKSCSVENILKFNEILLFEANFNKTFVSYFFQFFQQSLS